MDYKEQYDPEIDLKSLFFYILYRWRSVMVMAAVCCILFAAYKAVRLAEMTPEERISPKIKEYEFEMAKYGLDVASYEREIENNSERLAQQQVYMEKSVLMHIDPYGKPVATADILVRLDNSEWESLPGNLDLDPTDSLIKMYTSNFSAILDWDPIEKLTGNEKLYLEEILWVEADYNSNSITAGVVYSDGETAQKILDIMLSQILDRQEELSGGAGEHTLTVSNKALSYVIDHLLAENQKAIRTSLTDYERSLIDLRKGLDDLKDNEPSKPLIIGFVKYPVAGFVLGGLLTVIFYGASYFFGGRIHGEKSLQDHYGYQLLGVLPRRHKPGLLSCLDRFLDKRSSTFRSRNPEETYERISITMKGMNPQVGRILVTGTVSMDNLRTFTEAMSQRLDGVTLTASPDMNKDFETLRQLAKCDGVLLLEEENRSSASGISQEHECIKALDKPVVGYVLL